MSSDSTLDSLLLPHGPRPVVSHNALYDNCEAIIQNLKYGYHYFYYPTAQSRTLVPLDLTGRYVKDRDLIRFGIVLHDSALHVDVYDLEIAVIPFCSTDDSDHPVITFRPASSASEDFSTYARRILAASPHNVVIRESALLNLSQIGAGTLTNTPSSTNPPTSIVTAPPPPMAGDFNVSNLSLDHSLRIGQNDDEVNPSGTEEDGLIFSDACIDDLRQKIVTFLDAINEVMAFVINSRLPAPNQPASSPLNHQTTETQLFVDDVIGDLMSGKVRGSQLTVIASPIFMQKVYDVQTLLWQQQVLTAAIAASTDANERTALQQQLNASIALSGTVDPSTGALVGGSVTTNEWLSIQFLDATDAEEAASKDGRPGSWLLKTYVPIKYPGWLAPAIEMVYNASTDTWDFGKGKIYNNETDNAVKAKLLVITEQLETFLKGATGVDIPFEQSATNA